MFVCGCVFCPVLHHCAGSELFGGRSEKGQRFFLAEEGRTTTKPTRAFFSSWPDLSCFGADLAIACQKIKDQRSKKQPSLIFFDFLTNVLKDFEDFKRFCKWMLRDWAVFVKKLGFQKVLKSSNWIATHRHHRHHHFGCNPFLVVKQYQEWWPRVRYANIFITMSDTTNSIGASNNTFEEENDNDISPKE